MAVVAGAALVALSALLSLALAVLDSEAVAERAKDVLLPRVSEALGREVTVETASARLLPNPNVRLGQLVIHGDKGEPPLVEAQAMDVALALWPLIRSLGKEIRIDRVELVGAEVNVLRDRKGNWNFEGLGGQDSDESEREVSIDVVEVRDGTLRIIDRSGPHGEATVALTDVDLAVEQVAPGRPLVARGTAAFAGEAQNLDLELTLSSLPESLDALGPGKWPEVSGRLRLSGAEVTRLEGLLPAKLAAIASGGQLALDAALSTEEGVYVVDATADVAALRLRGEPADGGFHVVARVDPSNLDASRADFDRIAFKGPGLDLGGTASLRTAPTRLEFALKGPVLNLDTVLGLASDGEESAEAPPRTAVLPARMRKAIEDVTVRGSLDVDRVVNGRLEATGLSATGRLRRGVLHLESARAGLYGGSIEASGTTVNLLEPVPAWNLKARLSGVDASAAMTSISGAAPLHGTLDASLDLKGAGALWAEVRSSLTGEGAMALREGELTSTDLGGKVATGAAEGLRKMGRPGAAATAERAAGKTELRDLTARFTVKDGFIHLREPLAFDSNVGGGKLDGRIGLDLSLDLQGTLIASQEFLSRSLGKAGRLASAGPVEVPLSIGGTLRQPAVDVEETVVARRLVEGGVRKGAKKVEDAVRRQARRRLGDVMQRLGGGGR